LKHGADAAAGATAGAGRARAWTLVAAVVVGTVLTRLPQLLGPHVVLDGDEAVLSLMARRLARLEGLPLYFDGQKYGFSSLETAWVALHYAVLGASPIALKIAMLGLWSAGAAVLALALGRLAGPRAAWIGALLIVLCPGWGAWSLKGRGGYVTAFLLTAICRWILASSEGAARRGESVPGPQRASTDEPSRGASFALGLCASGALVAQPIWFLALAPWLVAFAWRQRLRPRVWLDAFAGATVTLVVIVVPGIFRSEGSWSPSLMNAPSLLAAIAELPRLLVRGFGGASYLRYSADEAPFDVAGILWLAAAVLAGARTVLAPGPRATAQRATLTGMVLVPLFATPTLTPRYLLPVMDATVFLLALQAAGAASPRPRRRASDALAALLAAAGLACLIEMRHLVFAGDGVNPPVASEAAALEETLDLLADRGVDGVYTLDNLLQWIVIDASGETIPARWKAATERTPIYIDRFAHLASSGGRLALLAYHRQRPLIEATGLPVEITEVAGRYVMVLDPSRELLDTLGFE